ncbi:hypothetical protein [Alteribacter aurantiacus]|uniref:hypothetical protein n=1 Tax=Alteribacter aurantiacus TaxID=254410 RepID=UPI0004089E11|nr:hypothetical protein [Alteribacter aurantiacus]
MKATLLGLLILFGILLLVSCQSVERNNDGAVAQTIDLSWGEATEIEGLIVKPLDKEVVYGDKQSAYGMQVEHGIQLAFIDLSLTNQSKDSVLLDRDFYYESFGICVEGESGVGRMDTDLFPFDGVFEGELKTGDTIDTRLAIYQVEGEMDLVFSLAGDVEDGYQARWKIDEEALK